VCIDLLSGRGRAVLIRALMLLLQRCVGGVGGLGVVLFRSPLLILKIKLLL